MDVYTKMHTTKTISVFLTKKFISISRTSLMLDKTYCNYSATGTLKAYTVTFFTERPQSVFLFEIADYFFTHLYK